jgi:hypothetical protein
MTPTKAGRIMTSPKARRIMTHKERKIARRHNSRRNLEPPHWNQIHLRAIGAELSFGCDLPSSEPAQEVLTAVLNTVPITDPAYSVIFPTAQLQNVADTALWLSEINTTPSSIGDDSRYCVCNSFGIFILHLLCPFCANFTDCRNGSIELHCGKVAVSWSPICFVGTHLWLVIPENPLPNFAEEVAFAVSIAQEFGMDPSEREFEVWLVSVRKAKAAVVHATISYSFLEAADQNTSLMGAALVIGKPGDVKVQASKEFRLVDPEERTQFVCILNGVAQWANSRVHEKEKLVATSWK